MAQAPACARVFAWCYTVETVAKESDVFKIEIEISDRQFRECAHEVVELYLINEFDSEAKFDALTMSGIVVKELIDDLAQFPLFRKIIGDMVRQRGVNSLKYDFDENFRDADASEKIRDLFQKQIYPVIDMMQDIIDHAEEKEDNPCGEAIDVLKKLGYKIVKA